MDIRVILKFDIYVLFLFDLSSKTRNLYRYYLKYVLYVNLYVYLT